VAVLAPPDAMRFQSQLELRDLARLVVAQQPVVGVAAVIAVQHDANVIIDGARVLQRLAGAGEFGLAVGVPTAELGDGGLGDHEAAGVDAEIVVAGDDAGKAVHKYAVAVGGHDIEDDPPALAIEVTGPVVVGDDDLMIAGVTTGGDESAAI